MPVLIKLLMYHQFHLNICSDKTWCLFSMTDNMSSRSNRGTYYTATSFIMLFVWQSGARKGTNRINCNYIILTSNHVLYLPAWRGNEDNRWNCDDTTAYWICPLWTVAGWGLNMLRVTVWELSIDWDCALIWY